MKQTATQHESNGRLRRRSERCQQGLASFLAAASIASGAFGEDTSTVTSFPAKPPETHEAHQLAQLSLEELLAVRVTSVSKRDQSIAEAPAAIYVLSQNEIHRSGVTSIAEALRLVPGLQVARQSGYEYAITACCFGNGA